MLPNFCNSSPVSASAPNYDPHDQPPPGSSAGTQRPLSDYLLILKEKWLPALLLGAIAAGALYFVKSREEPQYTARALIMFEVQAAQVLNIQEVSDPTLAGQGLEIGMSNYLEHLRSATFLGGVVSSLSEEERESIIAPYQEEGEDPPSPAGIIRGGFSFGQTGNGTAVFIAIRHRDPEMAAFIANRITDQFSNFILARSGRANEAAVKFLEAKADELRQRVREADLALQEYRDTNDVVSLDDSQNIVASRLASLNGAFTGARVDLVNARSAVNEIERAQREGKPLVELPLIRNYGEIGSKLSEIADLKTRREILSIKYLENHPDMIEIREALVQAENRVEQLIGEALDHYYATLSSAELRFTEIEQDLKAAERDALDLDRMAVEYSVLERKFQNEQRTYDLIITRLNEASIAAELVQSPILVVDEAGVPGLPSSPNRQSNILASVALFVTIFAGIPGLFAFIDMRIKGRADIENFLGEEYLGDVPLVRTLRSEELPRMVRDSADPVFIERINSLRARIQMLGKGAVQRNGSENPDKAKKARVLLFTSTLPEEGKSLLTNNLSYSFARHGSRTLLIDCDLRQPQLHRSNEVPNEQGLTTILKAALNSTNGHRPPPSVEPIPLAPNLDFMPAGGRALQPTELLTQGAFGRLLELYRDQYDLIVIDTPPAFLFTDAWQIARLADEAVVVSRYNKVSRGKLKLLMRSLRQTGVRILGVAFNGSPRSESGAYGYGYSRAYREYGRDRREKDEADDMKRKEEAEEKKRSRKGRKSRVPVEEPSEEDTPSRSPERN